MADIKKLKDDLDSLTIYDGKYVNSSEVLSFECFPEKLEIINDFTEFTKWEITHLQLLEEMLKTEEGKKIIAESIINLKNSKI